MDPADTDLRHLERARALARRGWGWVQPNPMVGCVLVREGEVVGEGWHRAYGGPHAEVVALQAAGAAARGSTAYVSLEPCNHHGKTPPCTEALAEAGVHRVVYGAADPGGEAGGGGKALRAAGIRVDGPIWDSATARHENPVFHHCARTRTPYVALKLALTLDGYIAEDRSAPLRITGAEAEREAHRLRSGFDAVMIGAGTARSDDPRLTVRHAPAGRRAPRRIVLDPDASLSPEARLFEDVPEVPLLIFTRQHVGEEELARLEAAGATVHPVEGHHGRLRLDQTFQVAWELGVRSILCEGGAHVGRSLLAEDHVQRLYLFTAPFALGHEGVAAFGGVARQTWNRFAPAVPPQAYGRDTLVVLDRVEDVARREPRT